MFLVIVDREYLVDTSTVTAQVDILCTDTTSPTPL